MQSANIKIELRKERKNQKNKKQPYQHMRVVMK